MNLLDEIKQNYENIDPEPTEPVLCPICRDLMNLSIKIYTDQSKERKTLWYQCFCGCIFNPRQNTDFSKYIKELSRGGWKHKDWMEYFVHVYFPLIEEMTYGRKILEVGYALPYILRLARDRGFICTGMDKHVARHSERGIECIEDDFEEHEFKHRKYDLIWFGEVIQQFKDPIKAMQKAWSLLRPEGVVFVSSPEVSLISKTGMLQWGHWDLRNHIMFTGERFKTEMERIGFKTILLRQNESKRFFSMNEFHYIGQRSYYDEPYIGGYDEGLDFDAIKKQIKEAQEKS
jgi:SAM-dependent methyltransferase